MEPRVGLRSNMKLRRPETSFLTLQSSSPGKVWTCEDGADRPGWVPRVRMIVGYGETKSGVSLEPSVGCDHEDGGRLEGELRGEDQFALVQASLVQGVIWTSDHVMPFQDIGG